MAETVGEVFVAVRPDLSSFQADIDSAIAGIVIDVRVGADTSQLIGDITDAVTALNEANPTIDVNANTDEVAQALDTITGAAPAVVEVDADTAPALDALGVLEVDAAKIEPTIRVDADTGPADDEIAALVSSAASDTIDIPVSASGSDEAAAGLDNVKSAAEGLHGVADITAGSAGGLTAVLGGISPEGAAAAAGIAAVAAGTTELFHAGLDAVSAEERFNQLLGEQARAVEQVRVGSLSTDLQTLGNEFGSTNAQMQQTTANLFQFAKNAGASDGEASSFADTIAALAARAISLNPQLGTLSDVADQMSVRLARGGRFAASFGLSLTASEIAARASADAGGVATSQLTLYEKASAAAAIATERYGADLGGVVAEGSKNAAVEVESLSATFHDAIEEIGKPLVAPVIELLHEAIEPGKEVGQIFLELGQIGLPLLEAGLHAAEGPLTIIGAALEIVGPPLKLIADLIDSIPTPVLEAAGAFGAFVFIASALPGLTELIAAGLSLVEGAIDSVIVTLAVAEPEVLLIGALVGALTAAWLGGADDGKKFQAEVDDITSSLADQNGVLDLSKDKVEGYVASQSEIGKNADQVEALQKLGLHFSDLADLTDHGRAGLDKLLTSGLAIGQMTDVTDKVTNSLQHFDNVVDINGRKIQINDDAIRAVVVNFKNLADAADKSAEAQARSGVESKEVTQAQFDQAVSAHTAAGQATDWTGVLNDLKPSLDATRQASANATDAQKQQADAAGQATAAAVAEKQALDALLQQSPGLAESLAAVGFATVDKVVGGLDQVPAAVDAVNSSFEGLALQIDAGHLSSDQMKAIADNLGVSADQLKQFVDGVRQAIDQLTSDATAKLPNVQATIDNIVQFVGKVPDALNPNTLIGAIKDNLKAVADYQDNIDFLFKQGLPRLTELALKEGPQVTASLVKGIKDGGPDVGKSLDGALAFADASSQNFAAHIHNDIAPQLALQTGLIGQLMTDSFGDTFKIVAPTAEQLQQAQLTAELANIPLSEALQQTAGKGAVAYEQAIGALPGITQGTINGVQTTIDAAHPGVETAGAGLGDAANTGFGGPGGIGQLEATTGTTADIINAAVQNQTTINRILGAGNILGVALDAGVIQGINFGAGPPDGAGGVGVSGAMVKMIEAAIDAARIAAGVRSPSTVFAEIGSQMAAGLVVGLGQDHAKVAAAAGDLVGAAALRGASSVSLTAAPVGSLASGPAAGQTGAGRTTIDNRQTFNINAIDPFVAAAETLRKMRSQSRELQR